MAERLLTLNPAYFFRFRISDWNSGNSRRSPASSVTAPKAGDSKSNPLTATVQKTSWDCIRITWCKYSYLENVKSTVQNLVLLLHYFLSHLAAPSKSNLFRYVSFLSFLLTQLLKSHFALYEIERLIAAGGERFRYRQATPAHDLGIEHVRGKSWTVKASKFLGRGDCFIYWESDGRS